jgi:hypothetical protein
VERQAKGFASGGTTASQLPAKGWSTHEWLHFLTSLPDDLRREDMARLDDAWRLTTSTNYEVLFQWLLLAIRHHYKPAHARLEEFLTAQGRRKFLKPLYEELAKTPEGKGLAVRIYRQARGTYHPFARETVDKILGWKQLP